MNVPKLKKARVAPVFSSLIGVRVPPTISCLKNKLAIFFRYLAELHTSTLLFIVELIPHLCQYQKRGVPHFW